MAILVNRRTVLAGLGVTTVLASATSGYGQTGAVRIGTSSVGSTYYTLAVGAGEIIREHAGINTRVEPVGGSAANVNGIDRDIVDIAIVNSFSAYSGYTGTFGFEKRIDLNLMMQGHPSYRYIFVRNGSGIAGPKDLEGKTIVAERRALPELRLIMDALIEHFELDAASMNIVATTESGESIDALRAGSVDAIIMPFSPRAGMIESPMTDGVMSFLPMEESDRDAILEKLPAAFSPVTQPGNDFSNQPDPVHLFALNTYMVCDPELDEATAYGIAKAMYENVEQFGTFHATGKQWTRENAVQKPALPFHPGVIRYLREAGVWTAENDATQERLLNQ